VLVVDAGSSDGTAEIAATGGRPGVVQESSLLPEFGEVLGKGDAMWRALSVLRGEGRLLPSTRTRRTSDRTFACGLIGRARLPPRDLAREGLFITRPAVQGRRGVDRGGAAGA